MVIRDTLFIISSWYLFLLSVFLEILLIHDLASVCWLGVRRCTQVYLLAEKYKALQILSDELVSDLRANVAALDHIQYFVLLTRRPCIYVWLD